MKRQDWPLLALSQSSTNHLSPVQVQKAMFLLSEEGKRFVGDDFYSFVPYNYGPFCSDIYSDLEALERDGKVAIQPIPGRRWSVYSITPDGLTVTDALAKEIDTRAINYLAAVVKWVGQLSFQQLVRAIYDKYPAFKANSVFRDQQ